MKKRTFCISIVILFCWSSVMAATGRKVNFNKDWKFHLGSAPNAEQPHYNDSKWRVLDLPHDWSVEPLPAQKEGITKGPFSRMSETGDDTRSMGGGGWDVGQTLGGEGWYRKVFTISKEDAGKRLSLHFEGVHSQSEVWINGKKANYNAYGYTPYKIDITDFCHPPGVENTIAVKAVNPGKNSRWYTGSGIYRHVWLIKTDSLHMDEWDTFINASELQGKNAVIKFSTILHNKNLQNRTGDLQIKVYSPAGKEVYSTTHHFDAAASGETPLTDSFLLKNPELWSVDAPILYTAEISLASDHKESDKITIPFGIRTIAVSAEKGFQLNGKTIKLKGGCLHHDNGLLGAAAIDRAEERKAELLKANGYNAVRSSHNLPSEHFLDACDKLGILVINEAFDQWCKPKRPNDYHQFFEEWSENDFVTMLRRDRNHPSVIMWSIGNEIPDRADAAGEEIAKRLAGYARQYDGSRFTTAGVNEFWDNRHYTWENDAVRAFRNIDIAGYNYMWKEYENDHQRDPKRIMYGSESVPKEAAVNWNLIDKHSYLIGDFVWTAIDYLGEAGLAHTLELAPGERSPQFMDWPWYNAWCGDIDFCGDKKPQSYYRDIIWKRRDISMAVQVPVAEGKREDVNFWGWKNELLTWNWDGMEEQPVKVNVYSRSPQVRLYLNGKLIGEKETGKEDYTAVFEVPYQPGVLKAVNLVKGKESGSVVLQTTGKPAAIRLVADKSQLRNSKNDLSYVKIEVIDEAGRLVTDAAVQVEIQCTGNGTVIAGGNAAPDDMESFRSLTPHTFRGSAIAIVQPNEEKGDITLTVLAKGLKQSSITIKTQ
ncbi:MAG: DUF4982 domain-containing protein [Tannerellaceae bacterium]|nr:DUF4982 domain-containing protein [Tannerellaceae bacterium]